MLVRILGKKHPNRLADVYRDVLKTRPCMQSWPLAEAVGISALPKQEKVELLVLATHHKSFQHRHGALLQLKDLDNERFIARLIASYDDIPKRPERPYPVSDEASLAVLACMTDEPRVWRSLEAAAQKPIPACEWRCSITSITQIQTRPNDVFDWLSWLPS